MTSSRAWLPGGKAFYYSRRLAPDEVPDGEEQYHRRVYLHQVGSQARDDVMVFGAGMEKTTYYWVSVSRDGRWLIIGASAGTAPRNDLWIADLAAAPESAPDLRVVQQGADAQTSAQVGRDGRLYLWTDRDAARGRIAVTDPAEPGYGHWRDLVPQDPEAVLGDFAVLDGPELERALLLVSWTRHAISEVSVHDLATGAADRHRAAARPGHDRRPVRTAGRRPRGVVRLHRQHHATAGAPLRRAKRHGGDLGAPARAGRDPGSLGPSGGVPVEGRHRGQDAGHLR